MEERIHLPKEKRLFGTFSVAGKEFQIYYEYYEQMQDSYPDFPDFVAFPEYTEEGCPFAHYIQEGCPDGREQDSDTMIPENCGCCGFFRRERPDVPIGVCMNEKRRRKL